MLSLERVWRGALALAIVGTIPLSMWGSGCSSQPLVQPDGGQSGGSPGAGGVPGTGGVLGTGGHASGGSNGTGGNQPHDASGDALSPCCSQSEETVSQCSPDGQEVRTCVYRLAQGATAQCSSPGYSYGYIWQAQTCPNGCVTVDGGVRGTGGAIGNGGSTGSGGSGSGGNFGLGGTFGSGGSSSTGGYAGPSARCQ